MPGLVRNGGEDQGREGEGRRKGRGGRGRKRFAWSIDSGNKVTVAVVSPLSMVLLWHNFFYSQQTQGQASTNIMLRTCSVMRVDWFRI